MSLIYYWLGNLKFPFALRAWKMMICCFIKRLDLKLGGSAGMRSTHWASSRRNPFRHFFCFIFGSSFRSMRIFNSHIVNWYIWKTMYSRFLRLHVIAQRATALWGSTPRRVQVSLLSKRRACVFLKWSKMVLIRFCPFLLCSRRQNPQRNQEQTRSPKPSLDHEGRIKTILGQFRNKHARYYESYLDQL